MHSHSFQDTELNLHRYVNDSPGQVVEGLTILRCFLVSNLQTPTAHLLSTRCHSSVNRWVAAGWRPDAEQPT